MNILDYIPYGHKNAISRATLSSLTRLSDRKMREMISEVNSNENPEELIINMQDGRGYFRPARDEDYLVRTWRTQEKSRGASVEAGVSAADRYLQRNRKKQPANEPDMNQITLDDWLGQMVKKP